MLELVTSAAIYLLGTIFSLATLKLIVFVIVLFISYVQLKVFYTCLFVLKNSEGKRMEGPFPFFWGLLKLFRSGIYQGVRNLEGTYDKICRLPLFTKMCFIVGDCDEAKKILLKNQTFTRVKNFVDMESMKDFLPLRGLATPEEREWARQRKHLNPGFDKNAMKNLVPMFQPFVRQLQDIWSTCSEQDEGKHQTVVVRDVYSDFRKLAMDIVGYSAFGFEFNALDSCKCLEKEKRQEEVKLSVLIDELIYAGSNPYIFIPFYTKLNTKSLQKMKYAIQKVNEITYQMIAKRREERKLLQKSNQQFGTFENCEPRDMLDILLMQDSEGNPVLSDEQVRDNSLFLLIAGHETTTSALSALFYEVSRRPDVQSKLHEEVDRVLGPPNQSNKMPSYEEFEQMPYVNATISETLRLYPPAAATVREVDEDGVKICGYGIPKGSLVVIPFYHFHLNKAYWGDNAQEFSPERWLDPEKNAKRPRMSFVPFSYGGHDCLGRLFAMNEMKLVVSNMLHKFSFTDAMEGKTYEIDNSKLLKPKYPINIRIQPRNLQ